MMKRSMHAIVALLLFAALAISCGRQQDAEYFPILEDGKQNKYSVDIAVQGRGIIKAGLVIRGAGQETINGQTYHKVVALFSGMPGAQPTTTYSRYTAKGIFTVDDKHKNAPERLDPPFPLAVGTTWNTNGKGGVSEYRVEAIEALDLPNLRYERCIKISITGPGPGVSGHQYFAPGVGMVKMVMKKDGSTMEAVLEN